MLFRRFKYRSIVFLVLCTLSTWAAAQTSNNTLQLNTDQLLQYYRSIKNPSQSMQPSTIPHDGKCGFGISMQVHTRWKEFTQVQRDEFSALLQASPMQCNTVVGHFRIFYDTSGINKPVLLNNKGQIIGTAEAYISSVASIFNHVWDVEVNQMGYTAPPFEAGQSYYNVYVIERNGNDYGVTEQVDTFQNVSGGPILCHSYIEIDNDYQEFPTQGIDGLKVTAAHEFHHAIQIGSYGFWGFNDAYSNELISTWFEDVVYTDVNDYYYYLRWYFNDFGSYTGIAHSFNSYVNGHGGYERCVWAHYLAKRFGPDIIRDIWVAMKTQPFLASTDTVLLNRGSSLEAAFAEFSSWNYFTADRANTEQYYPEGDHYPRYRQLQQIEFRGGKDSLTGNVQPLSTSLYEFVDKRNAKWDTITIIVANVDVENAKNRIFTPQRVDVILSSQSLMQPYQEIKNGLKVQISVIDASRWSYFVPPQEVTYADASPNPFRLQTSQRLLLPINEDRAGTAEVYFYNSSLDLAYSGKMDVVNRYDTRVIEVPTSKVKSKLSSGIYFIIAKTVNKDYKWKVAVIR